jgi:hypothetical protein
MTKREVDDHPSSAAAALPPNTDERMNSPIPDFIDHVASDSMKSPANCSQNSPVMDRSASEESLNDVSENYSPITIRVIFTRKKHSLAKLSLILCDKAGLKLGSSLAWQARLGQSST